MRQGGECNLWISKEKHLNDLSRILLLLYLVLFLFAHIDY